MTGAVTSRRRASLPRSAVDRSGLAWVHGELDADGWSVQVGDRLVPATVQLEPFHDPKGDRTRA